MASWSITASWIISKIIGTWSRKWKSPEKHRVGFNPVAVSSAMAASRMDFRAKGLPYRPPIEYRHGIEEGVRERKEDGDVGKGQLAAVVFVNLLLEKRAAVLLRRAR